MCPWRGYEDGTQPLAFWSWAGGSQFCVFPLWWQWGKVSWTKTSDAIGQNKPFLLACPFSSGINIVTPMECWLTKWLYIYIYIINFPVCLNTEMGKFESFQVIWKSSPKSSRYGPFCAEGMLSNQCFQYWALDCCGHCMWHLSLKVLQIKLSGSHLHPKKCFSTYQLHASHRPGFPSASMPKLIRRKILLGLCFLYCMYYKIEHPKEIAPR